MATLTAIVTAHEDEQNLRRILRDLHEWQVRKADEIIALASDIDLTALRSEFPKVRFYEEPNLGDWGHAKRAKGLDLATSDYAGWFNHDDSYHPDYILDMMRLAESGNDVVYCGGLKTHSLSLNLDVLLLETISSRLTREGLLGTPIATTRRTEPLSTEL